MIKEHTLEGMRAAFFNRSHETFAIFDKDFNVVELNDELVSVIGKDKQGLIGRNIKELSPGIEHTDRFKIYQEVLRTGESMLIENEQSPSMLRKTKAAKIRVFRIGDCVGVSAIDTTELKRSISELRLTKNDLEVANKHLEEKNKELQDLSYMAAHDLKAPVNNLKSLLDMMEGMLAESSEAQLIMPKLKEVVGHMGDKIQGLNEVVTMRDTMSSNKEKLKFEDLVKDLKTDISGQIEDGGVSIETDFSECPEIEFNCIQLTSLLYNLLTNSIKYRSDKRPAEVTLKSYKEKEKTVFECTDNGIGFDETKDLKKVFGLFKRVHSHVEGKGMGMYIVNSIVAANGGTIEVNSEINIGTTFKIYL